MHTFTHIHTYIHTCIHQYIHIYTHIHAYIHTCIHTYICIHTYSNSYYNPLTCSKHISLPSVQYAIRRNTDLNVRSYVMIGTVPQKRTATEQEIVEVMGANRIGKEEIVQDGVYMHSIY